MTLLRNALIRGAGAAIASAAVVMLCSRRETGSAFGGLNAVSHWAWGDEAAKHDEPSLKYTATGVVTHAAASVFWAWCSERFLASRRWRPMAGRVAGEAMLTSAVAFTVDYTITPKRLTPGYELRLSKTSLMGVYAAFAAGLALSSLLLPAHER